MARMAWVGFKIRWKQFINTLYKQIEHENIFYKPGSRSIYLFDEHHKQV